MTLADGVCSKTCVVVLLRSDGVGVDHWLQLKTEKIRVGAYGRTPLQG